MAAYLITGNPGSGKTSIAAELVALGHVAVDADEIAGWSDASGVPVAQPAQPSDSWLLQHRWVWSRERLDAPSNAGRNAAQRQQIIDGRPVFEAEMEADGAIVLDGRLPSAELARLVLARVGG